MHLFLDKKNIYEAIELRSRFQVDGTNSISLTKYVLCTLTGNTIATKDGVSGMATRNVRVSACALVVFLF